MPYSLHFLGCVPKIFEFRNPGLLRLSKELAVKGWSSDCRNKTLQKMFQFLGYSEKAGSGFPKIFMGTDEQHWERPTLREDFQLDQTYLNMPTVDLTEDSFQPDGGVKGGVKTTPITTPIRPESDQNPTRTRPEILDNLAPSCGLVYDALEKDNRLTYRMMAKALKLNKDTVNTAVRILIDHQLLRHIGPKKGGHWEIVKPTIANERIEPKVD